MTYNYPDSDVDDTPVEFDVRCQTCGKVEHVESIAEERWQYEKNEDGTYSPPGGECHDCMTGATANQELRAAVREWAEAFRDFHDALYEFQLITTHVEDPVGLAGEEEWQRAATRERKASERMDRADSRLMELAEKVKD